MSDHTKTFVPLEAWCYNSPELKFAGHSIDIGLFAEALIYYDCLVVNITNQPQFGEFLKWFIKQDNLDDFIALVRDGTIIIYDYSFATAPVLIKHIGEYVLMHLQDEIQAQPGTFEKRFLNHEAVQSCIDSPKKRKALRNALSGNVIEAKAKDFGKKVIDNATSDYHNPARNKLIVQAFLDKLYRFHNLGKPPEINVIVTPLSKGTKHKVTWNIDFDKIKEIAGKNLNFDKHTPLIAAAYSNRLLWTAAQMECDLYLGEPMSILAGDKLYESSFKISKTQSIIRSLQTGVEFPDIRRLVNEGQIELKETLRIRKKAKKFRDWLQNESDRDRDAIIAYHREVARELGIITAGRKVLKMFGAVAPGAVGYGAGSLIADAPGAILGAAAGGAAGYIFDLASKLGANWRPVVFGDWLKERIAKIVGTDE